LIVSPGIRRSRTSACRRPKRIVTPEEAFRSGADYIVVGGRSALRPIHAPRRWRSSARSPTFRIVTHANPGLAKLIVERSFVEATSC
jgi:hypothetical protein